jgi:hypothetical protein
MDRMLPGKGILSILFILSNSSGPSESTSSGFLLLAVL